MDDAAAIRRGPLIAVLGALTAVSPMTVDMYVPGFPQLTRSLHATPAAVQLSLTAFLVGLAVGQIVFGPISDGLGRRPVLLTGLGAFIVLSVACAAAPTIQLFVAVRLLAGCAAAAGVVIARAVITDRFHGPDIGRYFGIIAVILGIAPVAAPVVGGAILTVTSWRAIFLAQAGVGALLLASAAAWVPESLPADRRQRGGVPATFRTLGRLARRSDLMGYAVANAFAGAALFVYIGSATFVFQDAYHVSTSDYSLIFATNAFGMLLASAAFGVLAGRVRVNTLLSAAVALSTGAAAALVLVLLAGGGGVATTWAFLVLVLAGIAVTFPASMTIGQVLGRQAAGAASALTGGLQYVLGAVASPLVGAIGVRTPLPMAAVILATLGAAATTLACLARPWRGHGEPTADAQPPSRSSTNT